MKFVTWYTHVNPNDISRKLVRNPNYPGERTGIPHCVAIPLTPARNKSGFHAALEGSIKSEGVRNPPLLYFDGERYYVGFGGSRVLAAQRAGLERIPALVNAPDGAYRHRATACCAGAFDVRQDQGGHRSADTSPNAEAIRVDAESARAFFVDPPSKIWETPIGLDYHYSIERNRRDQYDPAGLAWVDTLDDDGKSFLDKEFSWLKR